MLRAARIDILGRSRVKRCCCRRLCCENSPQMQFGASLMGSVALASDASPRLREEDDLPLPKVSKSISERRGSTRARGSSPAKGVMQRHLHAAASKAAVHLQSICENHSSNRCRSCAAHGEVIHQERACKNISPTTSNYTSSSRKRR